MEKANVDITNKTERKGEVTLDRLFKIVSTICGVLLVWLGSDIRSDMKDMKAGYADLKTRLTLVEFVLKMDQKVEKLSTNSKTGNQDNTIPYFAGLAVSKPEDEYKIQSHSQQNY